MQNSLVGVAPHNSGYMCLCVIGERNLLPNFVAGKEILIMRIAVILTLAMCVASFTACSTRRQAEQALPTGNSITGDELQAVTEQDDSIPVRSGVAIVYVDQTAGKESLLKALKKMGAQVIYDYRTVSAVAIRLPDGMTVNQAAKQLKEVQGVLGVQPDRVMRLH